MKYFTRDLIERYGCLDDEADFRDAETQWEARLVRYEAELKSIEPELPEHIRTLLIFCCMTRLSGASRVKATN